MVSSTLAPRTRRASGNGALRYCLMQPGDVTKEAMNTELALKSVALVSVAAIALVALLVMIQPTSAQGSDEPSAWPAGLSNTATHYNVTLSWNDPGAVVSDLFGERMPDQLSGGLRHP